MSLVAALLIVRALGLFPSTGASDIPRQVPVEDPIAIDEPFPDALDPAPNIERVGPLVRRHHAFPFGVVCGHRVGDRADIVRCGRPAELIGFYASPAEPRHECVAGDAYSRRPDFSVCWLDLSGAAEPGLELLRLPGVRRWDLA